MKCRAGSWSSEIATYYAGGNSIVKRSLGIKYLGEKLILGIKPLASNPVPTAKGNRHKRAARFKPDDVAFMEVHCRDYIT